MAADPLVTDPPADARWPAATPALAINSGGGALPAVLHIPAALGPHPVVVLLHGFPGHERNFDLAQVLRALSDHRVSLARTVVRFLSTYLRSPR